MQYIFWMGSADIDDVILNAAGVLAGCGICALLRKTAVRLRISFESAVLAVAVVLGVIGLTAVFISDSSLFLLSTKNVTTVNEEIVKDFIDMEDDAHGSFISFSGMKLTIEQKIAYGDNEAVLQENSLFEVQEEGSSFEGKGEETALEPGTAAASEDEVSETDSAAKSERKVFEVNEDSEIYVCSVHLECIFDNVIGERIVYERLELDELVRNSSDVFGGCSQIRIWSRDGDKADRILITQID